MSYNVKLGNDTLTGVDRVELQNANNPAEYIEFLADGGTTSITVNDETFTQSDGNINLGTLLRQHQSLTAYRTASEQDTIDGDKISSTEKGAVGGVATLGSDGKVPGSQLPSETDPTVPSWAKQTSKPTYTASEVGAVPTTEKGVANGVATLGSDGKVPGTQLPMKTATVTLSASDWSNNTQTVNVTGVTASNIVQFSASSKADADAWSGGGVWCTAQGSETLTFTCETTPTDDIDINVLILL